MKLLLALLRWFSYTAGMPADPPFMTHELEGGCFAKIRRRGNGQVNWLETEHGYTVLETLNGFRFDTDILEFLSCTRIKPTGHERVQPLQDGNWIPKRRVLSDINSPVVYRRGLVLLIRWRDSPVQSLPTKSQYESPFSEEFTGWSTGSIPSYFAKSSNGKLRLTYEVSDWIVSSFSEKEVAGPAACYGMSINSICGTAARYNNFS